MIVDGVDGDVVKWYTRARKFPQLLGRFADGNKIPGGPYTITQAFGAGGVLLLAKNTTSIWAQYGLLGNAALLASVAYGVVLALGRVPPGARNPMSILAGIAHAVCAPRQGRIAGRPVRMRRPRRVQHRIVIRHPAPIGTAATAPTTARQPEPAPAPASVARPPAVRMTVSARPSPRRMPVPPNRPHRTRAPQPALSGVQLLLSTLPVVDQPEPKDS